MTPGSARTYVYALRDFAEFLVEAHGASPMAVAITGADVPPRNPLPAVKLYSPRDMQTFVSAARGVELRWWALLAYLVDTGRRIGETLSLRWDDFRLDHTPPHLELRSTKAGEPQYVPLSARLATEVFNSANIEKMKETRLRRGSAPNVGDPELMPFPWSYNVARARLSRFCEKAGLPDYGFHAFRHTVITERLARGVPIQAVAALAGHKSVTTTDRRYNHTTSLTYAAFVERS
jgi:integrase